MLFLQCQKYRFIEYKMLSRQKCSSPRKIRVIITNKQPVLSSASTERSMRNSYINTSKPNTSIYYKSYNQQKCQYYPHESSETSQRYTQHSMSQSTYKQNHQSHTNIANNIPHERKMRKRLNLSIVKAKPIIEAQKISQNTIFQNLCYNFKEFSRSKSQSMMEFGQVIFDCYSKRQPYKAIPNELKIPVNEKNSSIGNYALNRNKRGSKLSLFKDISKQNIISDPQYSIQLVNSMLPEYYCEKQLFSFGRINAQGQQQTLLSQEDKTIPLSKDSKNFNEISMTKQPNFKKHKLSYTNNFKYSQQNELQIFERQEKDHLLSNSYDTQIDMLNSVQDTESVSHFIQ